MQNCDLQRSTNPIWHSPHHPICTSNKGYKAYEAPITQEYYQEDTGRHTSQGKITVLTSGHPGRSEVTRGQLKNFNSDIWVIARWKASIMGNPVMSHSLLSDRSFKRYYWLYPLLIGFCYNALFPIAFYMGPYGAENRDPFDFLQNCTDTTP